MLLAVINHLLLPFAGTRPTEIFSIRPTTEQPLLGSHGRESAQLPGNHFCQKHFPSDQGTIGIAAHSQPLAVVSAEG